MWSLPSGLRHAVGGMFTRRSPLRAGLAMITAPAVAWIVFTLVYYGWHDSTLYNAALYHDWVHDLQHITFFLAAVLFWWPIIGPAPQVRGRAPGWGRFAYLLGAVPINMAVGITIAFTSEVLYSYYESVPRIWGLTVMQDQRLAGALMWIPGSMMFIVAALIVLASLFPRKGKAPELPVGWDSDSAMIAPGLERRAATQRPSRPPARPLPATKAP
jgi:cytochrome c oxidase assembly factor CtaG